MKSIAHQSNYIHIRRSSYVKKYRKVLKPRACHVVAFLNKMPYDTYLGLNKMPYDTYLGFLHLMLNILTKHASGFLCKFVTDFMRHLL